MSLANRMLRMSPFAKALAQKTNTVVRKAIVTGSTAGDFAVSGIKKGDKIISVIYRLTAAGNLVDFTSEFGGDSGSSSNERGNGAVVTRDGYINNTGGTTSASGQLEVMWESYY